jgi:hypothetical protein
VCEKCFGAAKVRIKQCGKKMLHTELVYRWLKAEQASLQKQIICSLSRWRIYGERDDFKRGMASLDPLALLKSVDVMLEDRNKS